MPLLPYGVGLKLASPLKQTNKPMVMLSGRNWWIEASCRPFAAQQTAGVIQFVDAETLMLSLMTGWFFILRGQVGIFCSTLKWHKEYSFCLSQAGKLMLSWPFLEGSMGQGWEMVSVLRQTRVVQEQPEPVSRSCPAGRFRLVNTQERML